MKRFELEVNGKKYRVEGESFKNVEMWKESGVPKIWKDNRKKVVETDISDEMDAVEDEKKDIRQINSLLRDKKVRMALIAQYKKLKKAEQQRETKPETKSKKK